ncbi:hypothetical protein FGG51_gp027 [Mycobacterium phage Astro]|uniref:Uncharacterized protein n=2 Tax=Fromanvirus astro TaxID=1195075 RepID=I6S354_9CAUD|nr:hypothetical protein AVT31_gp028 [Mycobacterium phage Smeadley]YP_009638537.1 hypothetical protein FGG51_gp027 [Mycobacterium phage Astro]AXQ63584.1 hypothetical protein SEA_DIXON_78 [Mycobacterium phage Dixon]QBI96671.1 hypothetical protein SEA_EXPELLIARMUS_76 [Mycobacterium phage Expelliarmus]AFM54967.1 hypothetical protein ASTRO_79 [Mycobacterium phage Astro]AKQ07647.1 hypothetical protein SEA_SMEADLEY_79 [Mycobacterium phage Smeadley]
MHARDLSGNHIGQQVEFFWHFPHSLVLANVMGELREVHHDGGDQVTLWLTAAESGDKTEFVVGEHIQVIVEEERR